MAEIELQSKQAEEEKSKLVLEYGEEEKKEDVYSIDEKAPQAYMFENSAIEE